MSLADSDHSSVSFVSWASNFTKCSNPVFKNILNRSWSDKTLHENVLTVLAGITKLIQNRNGSESATEYYAALLTALNVPSDTKAAEAYLLKVIMSRAVPDVLLRSAFGETAKILLHNLTSCDAGPADVTLLKCLIHCLGRLLRAQSFDSWSNESVRHIYRYLLRYMDHEKATVRKSCHNSVSCILNVMPDETTHYSFHPACHQTVDHLCHSIRQELRQLTNVLNTKDMHCTRLLHCLDLLTSILHLLPPKEVKSSCECILELHNFPNPLVVSKSFSSLKFFFNHRPQLACLPMELLARLLTALHACRPRDPVIFDFNLTQPGTPDAQANGVAPMISWISAIQAGCSHLVGIFAEGSHELNGSTSILKTSDLDKLVTEHLNKLIKCLLDLMITIPLPHLKQTTAQMLDALLVNDLDGCLLMSGHCHVVGLLLLCLATRLADCLSYQSYETWVYALNLIARLLRIWPRAYPPETSLDPVLITLVHNVAKLRDSLVDGPHHIAQLFQSHESIKIANVEEFGESVIDGLDRVCLVALESLGPEVVLADSILPLEPIVIDLESGTVDLCRSWFLPILARAKPVNPCALSYFVNHVIPLADRSLFVAQRAVAQTTTTTERSTALITAGVTVAKQLWSSLSMFVRQAPRDWSELSSTGLGRRLVKELTDAPALRSTVLFALRHLAVHAQSSDAGLRAMRGGAKLAIPTMLSLYESSELPADLALRQQLCATLLTYLPCLTDKMILTPTKLALQKLNSTQNPVYFELLQILMPHNSPDVLDQLLSQTMTYLSPHTCKSRALVKRAYRLLERICSGLTPSTDAYTELHVDELLDLIHRIYSSDLPVTQSDPQLTEDVVDDMAGLSVATNIDTPLFSKHTKKLRVIIPWKPRLTCLHHLLWRIARKENLRNTDIHPQEITASLDNVRLREFATRFLPEILAAVCESNRLVRKQAFTLLTSLIMAFAGQIPCGLSKGETTNSLTDQSSVIGSAVSEASVEDEDAVSEAASSIGMSTAACTDVDDLMSTRSMPRGSQLSQNICSALHLLLSRVWQCLPPKTPPASSSTDLSVQESAASVLVQLIQHIRFRRAVLFSLDADNETTSANAAEIVQAIRSAAHNLIKSKYRPLAKAGVLLIRSLIGFIGTEHVTLMELVHALQSLHAEQKRPLRFLVKATFEKLVKKFGRTTIQSMVNKEYLKVVRNSARVMARHERQRLGATRTGTRTGDEDDASVASGKFSSRSKVSTTRLSKSRDLMSLSSKSHLSLPTRFHVPRFDELLAGSSDDEPPKDPDTRSVLSTKSKTVSQKPKSLAEELESVHQTSGLCRRAKRNLLHPDSSGDSTDDEIIENKTTRGIRRAVRFADTASATSTGRLGKKHRRRALESNSTDLWLIEQPDADIIDLSDPKALARHTAFATDAETAKAMAKAFQKSNTGPNRAAAPFPVVDGKLIIDAKENPILSQDQDWGMRLSEDEDDHVMPSWKNPLEGKRLTKPKARLKSTMLPGQQYASTKAMGDMRRPGQPNPYAYIGLGSGLGTGKKANALERRRLLRAVGMGKHKRMKMDKPRPVDRKHNLK